MPANLNRKQQREIKAVVERAKKDNGIPQTAQQSIPFQRMFPDGICRVTDSYYTKTIQFQDINYQLAQQEDKTAIFDEWCSFLNFFDSSIHFELSFMNLSTDAESFEKSIRIPFKKDSFNPVRAEYSQMLKKQLAQGNNGLTKTKYLTFGIEAESMRQAKPRLNHIENDLLNNFRRLGVIATTMNGKERLHLMHSMFHMGDNDKFFFDWKYLVESGLSVKDFIAPTAFAFKTNRTFQMGSIFGSMSYLAITASDLSDRMLADFLDMESTQIVTMHIQSVDQTAAIKTIKRIITELDRSKIEEQKKAVRSGYDMDIIPSDLATYGKDAKSLLKELQSQNERMFMVTFLVLNTGRTEQELENNVFQAQSIAQKHNCNLRRLDFQQESGLMSSLPLAQNLIEIRRGLTTSSTAIFVPFTTQELFQNGGETLYYGLNALSNNLIMVDRKKLKNPNGLILGTPGSGKSFSAKREITNAFLVTDDDIIICDPEAEYAALVHKFNGQVVKISSSSTNYINPMDINLNYSEDDNPVALKADFILSLCELIMGSKDGLQPIEKTVIDRCVHQIYQRYFDNPAPENMPILEDLYDALLKQDEKEAHHVATALEIYVKGSLKLFNNRTNVDESVATEEPAVEEKVPETEPEEPMLPLTPDGNLTLVDDAGSPTKSGKQFITAVTKNGNYFYIIIDRDDKGEETVHFLNQVDEADLLKLMDEEEVAEFTKPVEETKPEVVETVPEITEPTPEEKPKSTNMLPAILTLIVLACGGGFFVFKKVQEKKKAQEAAKPDPDADYVDDDEDYGYDPEFEDDDEDSSVDEDDNEPV